MGSGSVGSAKNLPGSCMVRFRVELKVNSLVLNLRLGVIAILQCLLDFGVRGRGRVKSRAGPSADNAVGAPKTGQSSKPLMCCDGPCTVKG